ncbi:MAG: YlbF family regulator [Clostridia bacterium]|nr:YlbF family regulator [Clostridia bacterium]
MEVLEQAKLLGKAIADSDIFVTFKNAEAAYLSDSAAQELTQEYNKKREQLAKQAAKEDVTPQELLEVRKQINAEFEKLTENDVIRRYVNTKQQLDEMMNKVDSVIRFEVTGEEQTEGGCSGSCGSCGGCH